MPLNQSPERRSLNPRPGGNRRRRSAARVRAGLRDGSVPANADGGRLHNIAGETHMVAPACLEALVAGRHRAAAMVRSRVVRRRESGGGIRQATYAAQSAISSRRRSKRSLRR